MNIREIDDYVKKMGSEGNIISEDINNINYVGYSTRGYDPSDESDYESDSDEQTWEEEDDDDDYEEDDEEGEDY